MEYNDLSLQLEQANQKIEQLTAELSSKQECFDFYANISHDLRAPISAINSSVEYLLSFNNLEQEEITTVLKLIQSRGLFLQNMINEIFTLTSIRSTDKKLQLEEVEMGIFLEEYFYSCSTDSKYNNRILHLQIPIELECVVLIDPQLILRVLDNLFINALKYSRPGDDIWLSAEITPQNKFRFAVKDSGIGIASENIDKIFERSFMVSQSRTPSSQSGCGLGLAIAKTIVEKHHGTIWCESEEGVGSAFFVELNPLTFSPCSEIPE